MSKVVKLTTFKTIKRGNWFLRFSCTDLETIMIMARSVIDPDNTFVLFFSDEESAASFADFLVLHDTYTPDPL